LIEWFQANSQRDLPLIVSLEVHTNAAQQQIMVDIMHETFKGLLCPPLEADKNHDAPLPTPAELRNKILIKVKYSSPKKEPSAETAPLTKPASDASSLSSSDEEAEPASKEKPKKKVSKIIDALSQLGIYTRSFHFSGFTSAEAKIPTHVFSLSESSLTTVHKEDPESLFNHNKCFLMRAYPKGTRIASSNLDPSLFWRVGVQMVALNWQKIDRGMMLQEAMFQGTYRSRLPRPTPGSQWLSTPPWRLGL
jgi:hypothetical protein